jgi:carbamoyltransferase
VNQRILELPEVKSVYIFPNMGDGGLNAGAALAAGFRYGFLKEKIALENLYLGKDFTDEEIESALKKQNLRYKKSENIASDIAESLLHKKVVARFSGRMEYGPRALGNRSIIYPATDKNVNTWLNQCLKRTEFMPFAPFVRNTDYKEYFEICEEHILPYKFMTITCCVTGKCRAEAPAITHVDGTARPQIIFHEANPVYYDILTEYKKRSGIGVLVNTSFNMHEEPIINSPEEAVLSFKTAALDMLAIGNFVAHRE